MVIRHREADLFEIANENIESLEELEEILSKRCCVLSQMTEEIKNLTNYHWLKYG